MRATSFGPFRNRKRAANITGSINKLRCMSNQYKDATNMTTLTSAVVMWTGYAAPWRRSSEDLLLLIAIMFPWSVKLDRAWIGVAAVESVNQAKLK